MGDMKCPECGAGVPADYPACGYCREPVGKGAGALPISRLRRRTGLSPSPSRAARQRAPVGTWQCLVSWAWGDPVYALLVAGLVLGVILGIGAVICLLLRGADLRERLPYLIPGSLMLLAAIALAIAKRGRGRGDDEDGEGKGS